MFSRWLSQINPISAVIDLLVAVISGYLISRIPQKKVSAKSASVKPEPTIVTKGDSHPAKEDKGPFFIIKPSRHSRAIDTGSNSSASDGDMFAIVFLALILTALTVAVMAKHWFVIRWTILAAITLLTATMFYFRNFYKFDTGRQLFTAAFLIESFIVGLIVLSLQFKIGDTPTIEEIGLSLNSLGISSWVSSTTKLLGISGLTIWFARIVALSLSLMSTLNIFAYSLGLRIAPTTLEGSVAEFRAKVAGALTKGQKYTIERLIKDIVAGTAFPLILAFAFPVLLPIITKPR